MSFYPSPKKSFGQHFLQDNIVLEKIIAAIDPAVTDTIIEIGPGRGVLTEKLVLTGAQVIGVELDRDLIPVLTQRFGSLPNFSLIHEDILRFTPFSLHSSPRMGEDRGGGEKLDQHPPRTPPIKRGEGTKYKLVGNIPYNLTTKLFEKILAWQCQPERIVFLLQKEVGERIVQKGGKNSALAVCVDMLGKPRLVCQVPPKSFSPPPKVDSTVLVVDGAKKKVVENPLGFYDFVHKISRLQRKTLLNNLIQTIPKEKALMILKQTQIDPQIRPEKLEFESLFKLYCNFPETLYNRNLF